MKNAMKKLALEYGRGDRNPDIVEQWTGLLKSLAVFDGSYHRMLGVTEEPLF